MSVNKRVMKRIGAVCMTIGAVGIAVWAINRGIDCNVVDEVLSQMKRCGSEYANDMRQIRFVPVALLVILFGLGLLMFTYDSDSK